ncbi:hypothetical protein [Streptomyces sp. NPDC000851]
MRKYQKAAVVMAMLGSVSFLGAGVGHADGGGHDGFKFDNKQHNYCSANETNMYGTYTEAAVTPPAAGGFLFNDRSDKNWNDCDNSVIFGGR